MKPRKPFLKSNLFACLLAFTAMATFVGLVWIKIRPDTNRTTTSIKTVDSQEPKDNFQRPGTQVTIQEDQVSAIKRESDPVGWSDDYRVFLQLNFPDSTRSAFILVVRHEKSKCLLMALVDTRSDESEKKIWIGSALDRDLKPDHHAIPFEIDEIRKIQARFRKFEPYWIHPSHRNQLLTRDEWLSGMTLALMQRDAVK